MSVQAVFFSLLPHSLIELFHTSTSILNLSLFLVWFIFLTYDVCIIYIIQVSDHLALWWNASTPQVTQVSAQAHFGLSLYKGPITTNQGDRLPLFLSFILARRIQILHSKKATSLFFLYEVDFSELSQREWRHQPIMLCKRDVTSQFMRMSDLWLFTFVSTLYCMTKDSNLWRKYDKGEMGWVTSLL